MALTIEQAEALGYTFDWSDDWSVGSHFAEYGEAYDDGEPDTCELVILRNADGNCVDSLGCIDNATDEYRREIELELLRAEPEPDTYATSEIDGLRIGDSIKIQVYTDGAESGHDFSDRTKWLNISPEELSAIRAILAKRTL